MDEKQITAEPAKKARSRWFRLTPDQFIAGLLVLICVLWLSERFQWFGLNQHKGWTVLIAVAAVGVAALVMPLWWVASLMFRWRFQLGIRSLLTFCLACSTAVSWLAVEGRQARRQAEVVEWIQKYGGWGHYDWAVDANGHEIPNPTPPGSSWLRRILGDDFFSAVVQLEFDDPNITDAGLEHLKGVTQLRVLILTDTGVTDAGLEYLKCVTQLRVLGLCGTKITDAGLEHVKELSQLQLLLLAGTKITDAGLEHLKGLTQLRWLYLGGSETTMAGIERLQHSLPNCKIER